MRAWALSLLLLAGCSGVPSFYDGNESLLAVEARFYVDRLNCDNPKPGVEALKDSVDMLAFYSESKESKDLTEMLSLLKETVSGLDRENLNPSLCRLKKKVLEQQTADIANAVMWRF